MGRKLASVEFIMKLPAVIEKREKWYVSYCPPLDVVSQGDTEEKAKANLIDAVSLFVRSCFERGTLDEVLKQCGFKLASKPMKAGRSDDSDYIDIPMPFMIDTSDPNRCHA